MILPLTLIYVFGKIAPKHPCGDCHFEFIWPYPAGIADAFGKVCTVAKVAQSLNCSYRFPKPPVMLERHQFKEEMLIPDDALWTDYFKLAQPLVAGANGLGEEAQPLLDALVRKELIRRGIIKPTDAGTNGLDKEKNDSTEITNKTIIDIQDITNKTRIELAAKCKPNKLNIIRYSPAEKYANYFWDIPRKQIEAYMRHNGFQKQKQKCALGYSDAAVKCARHNVKRLVKTKNKEFVTIHIRRNRRAYQYPANCSEPENVVRVFYNGMKIRDKNLKKQGKWWPNLLHQEAVFVKLDESNPGYRFELVKAFNSKGIKTVIFEDDIRTARDNTDMIFRWRCIQAIKGVYGFEFHPTRLKLNDPSICPPCPNLIESEKKALQESSKKLKSTLAIMCSGRVYDSQCNECGSDCVVDSTRDGDCKV